MIDFGTDELDYLLCFFRLICASMIAEIDVSYVTYSVCVWIYIWDICAEDLMHVTNVQGMV